ncbi:TonB-dependent receptor plug domain-containing protein [Arenibaculum pallidiluteum]|uniref:TonB-dependent receptor plug domain-containing protein n=1 Tax=Arenibaculum pallidiluteum TaxID=2812559 RepID=UPI001A95AAB8|nr:TonB-dependent receptor [Arenibaculum pallidiluteum]
MHDCAGLPARFATTARLRTLLVLAPVAGAASLPSLAWGQEPPAAPVLLDPVSVTANLVPTTAEAVGSAVTVFRAEELEARQTRTVADVLREVPGVALNRSGPAGQLTRLRIRGSESNQTLVVIDGIKANDPSAESEFDFAHLMAEEVDRVEVLRGPQSALYGSEALGGVVNIVTRRGAGRPGSGTGAEATAEGGSFGTRRGHAAVGSSGETYDFRLGGMGFRTDGVSVADARNGNTERDGYRNTTGFASFGLRPSERLELSLVGRYTDYRTETDGFVGGPGAVDDDSDTVGRQLFGRAEAKARLLDGRWEHVAGASVADHDRDYRGAGAVTARYEGRTTRLDYRTSLLFDTPAAADAAHAVTLAVQRERSEAVSTSAWSSFERSIDSTGFVGQYQATLLESLTLTGALRHDENELFEDATTYRLTGAYAMAETGTKLRASLGTGVKNPTLFELYGYTGTYRGNPALAPERGRGWDFGVEQEVPGLPMRVEATWFDQRISDLITGTGISSVNLPGESRIHGLELGLSARPVEAVTLRAAYTLAQGEDATGARLVHQPRHVASLDVTWRLLDDRATANLGVVYNGRQDDWAYDAAYDRSMLGLEGYTLVNLAASYRVTETTELFGRVENLFDARYQEVFTYGAPGRAAYAGLRIAY